jgi:uncharacterized protein
MSKSNLAFVPSNPNVGLIQSLYAAFARGDIDSVVASTTSDVVWGLDGREQDMPFLRRFEGPQGVRQFFQVLAEVHEITSFTPREFYADADKVFVIGGYSWIMKPSGRAGESEWVHIWTIRNGKVSAMRSLNDTALLSEAYRG